MSDEPKTPSAEDAIIDARRAQAREVRARGENPFANDVTARMGGRTCDIGEARAIASAAKDPVGRYDDALERGHLLEYLASAWSAARADRIAGASAPTV